MHTLDPPAIYAHESAMADARLRRRVEAVAAALAQPQQPVVYSDEQLPALIHAGDWTAGMKPMGTLAEVRDPILVFNTFRFDGRRQERIEWFDQLQTGIGGHVRDALLGYGAFNWFPAGLKEDVHRADKVCRACWRLHFQSGCVHRCAYCSFGGLLVSMVNVEEYVGQLDRVIRRHPWQKTYLLEDDADVLCLEPELGCLGPIIEHFGRLKDRYLVLHTKSATVDWMLPLKHKGHTIIVWSIAAPTQAREVESATGTTEERVEAARKCREAGYTIRYKFKPIIPLRGWREDAARAVELAMARTRPDVISLCAFMWMEVEEMKRRLDPETLDPRFLWAAESSTEEVKDTLTKPFPEWARAEIYEHYLAEIRKWDAEVPVSLSTETWGMWRRFQARLGMTASNYVCGCGPQSTPGLKQLRRSAWSGIVKNAEGLPDVT